jgi:hypothetical protein
VCGQDIAIELVINIIRKTYSILHTLPSLSLWSVEAKREKGLLEKTQLACPPIGFLALIPRASGGEFSPLGMGLLDLSPCTLF